MQDMIDRIDEVLNDEESYSPEYIVATKQKRYETALQAHARRVEQERWLIQGVKLGAVEPVWDGANEWRYVPAEDCELWFKGNIIYSLDSLPNEPEELDQPETA